MFIKIFAICLLLTWAYHLVANRIKTRKKQAFVLKPKVQNTQIPPQYFEPIPTIETVKLEEKTTETPPQYFLTTYQIEDIDPLTKRYTFSINDLHPDPLSIFYGKKVAVTGTLAQMERQQAERILTKIGAIVKHSVGKTTDFLIVGRQDYYKLNASLSTKERAAMEWIEKGATIKILEENEFYDYIAVSIDAR